MESAEQIQRHNTAIERQEEQIRNGNAVMLNDQRLENEAHQIRRRNWIRRALEHESADVTEADIDERIRRNHNNSILRREAEEREAEERDALEEDLDRGRRQPRHVFNADAAVFVPKKGGRTKKNKKKRRKSRKR